MSPQSKLLLSELEAFYTENFSFIGTKYLIKMLNKYKKIFTFIYVMTIDFGKNER